MAELKPQQTVQARVFKASSSSSETKQIYEDPFKDHYSGEIIQPKYNLGELKELTEYSTILRQCIDAYKTNIIGFGLEPEYLIDINGDDEKDEVKNAAKTEHERLDFFIKYMNLDESSEIILGYAVEDREKTGNGFLEVLRDGTGSPVGIEYMDVQYTRVCKRGESVSVTHTVWRGEVKETLHRNKRFRKFVQDVSGEKVYFKEYGDPRRMNAKTGRYDENTPDEEVASEVIHFKLGSGVYGVPRWIGNIVNVYGARKAEELNWLYFKQGRHTPAAITVDNGMLSEKSYEELQKYMDDLEGVENAHKFLLLEAEGLPQENMTDGGENVTPVKVQIKSLAEMVQNDALFLDYDARIREKIRSSFRLTPIHIGEAQDYNRSTADTARKVTEEQVFEPERKVLARRLNALFMNELDMQYVRYILKVRISETL